MRGMDPDAFSFLRKGMKKMTIDLQTVQARLERKRSELQEEIAYLHASSRSSATVEETEERGETASETTERENNASVLDNQQQLLAKIELALQRLATGTYGYCMTCGQPIPEKRLEALPWAIRDVRCEGLTESTFE